MKTFHLEKYGSTHTIQLAVNAYYYGGNLAIQMFSFENGYAEPWSDLTVNLDDTLPLNCAYIDTNNNGEDILDWIKRYQLAVPTGRYSRSGFCQYPEYHFDTALLYELDPVGYTQYLHGRKQNIQKQSAKNRCFRRNEKWKTPVMPADLP